MRHQRILYLDLDCVLADFVTPFVEALGIRPSPEWPRGVYDIPEALGTTREHVDRIGKSLPASWWANLPRTMWFGDLLGISAWFDDVYVATKPWEGSEECIAGKREWCRKHLPGVCMIALPDKSVLSRPGATLIDDCDANIDAFNDRRLGGHGILFPRLWNRMHDQHEDPMRHVTETVIEGVSRVVPKCHACKTDMVRTGRPNGQDYAAGEPLRVRMFVCDQCGASAVA